MKKMIKIFFLTALSVGIISAADAQRNRNSDGAGRGRSGSSQPHYDRSNHANAAPVRSFPRNSNERNNSVYMGDRNASARTYPQRRIENGNAGMQRNAVVSREFSRPSVGSRYNDRYAGVRYGNTYRYTNNYYVNGYRNGYGHRVIFMNGPRYRIVPRNSISIYFGGNPYYYNQGCFYGYYGGFYQPLFPPFGLRISVLPFGYTRFYVGMVPFFYYNGIYYRQYNDNNYEVVDAPMGATVSSLPTGAKLVVVNGEKLYELNGTYYKADRDSKGNEVYTVVGKNGEINNTPEVDNNTTAAPPASLEIGDILNQLPEGTKTATINGEKVYVTPDGNYLEEENIDGVLKYKVIGK